MRNIQKQIEQGKRLIDEKDGRIDLTAGEIDYFFEEFEKTLREQDLSVAIWNILGDSFRMGLAVGARNFKQK